MINSFENTNSEFKFYNIKANAYIDRSLNKEEMKNICVDIISMLGLEESQLKWIESKKKAQSQVYAQIEEKNKKFRSIIYQVTVRSAIY